MSSYLRVHLWVLLSLLSSFFMRCSNSSLSSEAVADPSLLRVNVNISRSRGYDGAVTEHVEAFIRDANDKPVANRQILVTVNGKVLQLNNGSSNYYGAYPYYQLADSSLSIKGDGAYTATVTLTNGNEYTLGTIQTQPDITPGRFLPPVTHARHRPLILTWHELEPHNGLVSRWKSWQGETSTTELKISKSNRVMDEWNNVRDEPGSADEADYLTTAVSSGDGAYTIPESYFLGPMNPYNTLNVLIMSAKSQIIGKPFLSGSAISSNRTGMYRIKVTH